ncbi:hypothetical protein BCS58_09125 [Enterovibrio norvegicus]|uniref:hypothetical protein n=1 Tax=Enterovibrio norvegicus TaxID=188144 RepID=UPI00389A7481
MFRKSLIISLALLGTGCVSLKPYESVQPPDDSASLTIQTDQTRNNVYVLKYNSDMNEHYCSSEPVEMVAMLNNVSVITKYADEGNNTNRVEVKIPADQKFRFVIDDTIFYSQERVSSDTIKVKTTICKSHVSFTPEKGKKYLARNYADKRICETEIFEIKGNGDLELTKFENHPLCYDADVMEEIWEEKVIEKLN